jgi:hypothetical protein
LNTILEISNKITQCSQHDRLEIIISLRAFLFDSPVYYWIDFTYSKDYEKDLVNCQNLSPAILKKINEDNIKKIGIKSIDLFLLPKNKKLYLINIIDEIFEDLQIKVVFDKLRLIHFTKTVYIILSKITKNIFLKIQFKHTLKEAKI